MAELLPEDLAQVLTPAQAADRVKAANGAYIRAQSKGTVPRAIGLEMTNSRQAFADAMARDKGIQQEYGGYDSFAQDIGRNMGNAWDAVKGFAAHTAGIFGDANEMVPGPLQSPIGKNLPTSVEIGEAMGADVDNPGFTIAGLASPLPNELLAVGKLAGPALAAAMAYQKVATKAGGKTPALTRMLDDQRGGPLLHASPFKFDFFDEAHMGRGEGFQAYSPGGFYFSDADLQRGTHPGYLSQFGRHDALGFEIKSPTGDTYIFSPGSPDVPPGIQKNGSDLPIANAQEQLNWLAADITENINSSITNPDDWVNEAAVGQLLSRIGNTTGSFSEGMVREMLERAKSRFPDDEVFIKMEAQVLDHLGLSKQEPYSYKIDISDDIKDNLPIYEVPIKDQPAKYRGAVEELARGMLDEDALRFELKDAEESLETWKRYLKIRDNNPGGLEGMNVLDTGYFDAEIAFSFDRNKLLDAVARQQEYAKGLRDKLKRGVDIDRTYGELVRDLQATHGDEAAQRMLYDAGIPGSRNRTWATRRKLTTPAGAMGQLFGHLGLTDNVDEVYNYAIWDMNTIDEVVRRQTKGGKILEDTAETVYTRSPPKPKKMEADRLQLQWAGSQRYGPLEVLQNPSQQQLGRFRRDIRTDYLAEGLNPNAEPLTRSTQDANGNHWYWRADRGTHYGVEELLKEQKLGDIKLNQNRPGGDK